MFKHVHIKSLLVKPNHSFRFSHSFTLHKTLTSIKSTKTTPKCCNEFTYLVYNLNTLHPANFHCFQVSNYYTKVHGYHQGVLQWRSSSKSPDTLAATVLSLEPVCLLH